MLWLIVILLEDEVIQKAFTTVFRIVVLEEKQQQHTNKIEQRSENELNILCRQN